MRYLLIILFALLTSCSSQKEANIDSINIKIKPLDVNFIIYPGHGAGSACGKNMMKATSDTLKNQKLVNYSMNGTVNKNEFIKKLTDNLPEPPAYFPSNVILNKDGYDDIDNVIKSGFKVRFRPHPENLKRSKITKD